MSDRRINSAVLVLVAALVACPLRSSAQNPSEVATAASTFQAKCAMCHAADLGGDTPMGKKLSVPDLRSPEVQNKPDREHIGTITKGMKNMPAFGDKLSKEEIVSLASYLRETAGKQRASGSKAALDEVRGRVPAHEMATHSETSSDADDIASAVRVTAQKDCGCGQCAAKGCEPCKGKNCHYCVAKALVVKECGCGGCNAKGCSMCGPGCDVCKFHLAPSAAAKSSAGAPSTKPQ